MSEIKPEQIQIKCPETFKQESFDMQAATKEAQDESVFTAVAYNEKDYNDEMRFDGQVDVIGGSNLEETLSSYPEKLTEDEKNEIYESLTKNPEVQKEYIENQEYRKLLRKLDTLEGADKYAKKETAKELARELAKEALEKGELVDIPLEEIKQLYLENDTTVDSIAVLKPKNTKDKKLTPFKNLEPKEPYAELDAKNTYKLQEQLALAYGEDKFSKGETLGFQTDFEYFSALQAIYNNPANKEIFEGIAFDSSKTKQIEEVLLNRIKQNDGKLLVGLEKINLQRLANNIPEHYTYDSYAATTLGKDSEIIKQDKSLNNADESQLELRGIEDEGTVGNTAYFKMEKYIPHKKPVSFSVPAGNPPIPDGKPPVNGTPPERGDDTTPDPAPPDSTPPEPSCPNVDYPDTEYGGQQVYEEDESYVLNFNGLMYEKHKPFWELDRNLWETYQRRMHARRDNKDNNIG